MHSQHQHTCHRLRRTPHLVREFTEFTAPGILLEDAMSVPYWLDTIHNFRLGDVVNIIAADGRYDVSLRIVRLDNVSIGFRILRQWWPEIDETADTTSSTHPTAFDGVADLAHLAVVSNPESSSRHAA